MTRQSIIADWGERALLARGPIDDLALYQLGPGSAEAEEWLATVLASSDARALTCLFCLDEPQSCEGFVRALSRSSLPQLRELRIGRLDESSLMQLGKAELPKLERLALATQATVPRRLAASPVVRRLTTLEIYGGAVTTEAALAFAAMPHLRGLAISARLERDGERSLLERFGCGGPHGQDVAERGGFSSIESGDWAYWLADGRHPCPV
jgi:hypothetical protein